MVSRRAEVWQVLCLYISTKVVVVLEFWRRPWRRCPQTKAWLLWICLSPFRQITRDWIWNKQQKSIFLQFQRLGSLTNIMLLTESISHENCFLVHRQQSSRCVLSVGKGERASSLWSLLWGPHLIHEASAWGPSPPNTIALGIKISTFEFGKHKLALHTRAITLKVTHNENIALALHELFIRD